MLTCWGAGSASAQTAAPAVPPPATAAPAAATPGTASPADPRSTPPADDQSHQLDRVRAALSHKPRLDLDANRLRFYVEIAKKRPTFSEFAKDYDFVNGATRGGDPMSYQEFRNMVTPRELRHNGGLVLSW